MGVSSEANTASGVVGVQTPPSGPLHRTHVLTQPGTVAAHAGQRPGGAIGDQPHSDRPEERAEDEPDPRMTRALRSEPGRERREDAGHEQQR